MHRKLALVIGNGKYERTPLRNTENDANDINSSLKSIGFQVTNGLHLTGEQMDSYVKDFVEKIQPSDLVLFYFSGHGTQWEDQNYLVPCDNENLGPMNIKRRAINAQHVLDQITKRRPHVSIFILDCCRNYYVDNAALRRGDDSNAKGLKEMHAAVGSLIAFACAPGSTSSDGAGRNGLYTKHLLEWITKPNEQIQDIFIDVCNGVANDESNTGGQTPWSTNSLRDRNIMLSHNGGGGGAADTPSNPIEEEEVQTNSPQMFSSNSTPNWPPINNGQTTHSFHFSSSGFDSNSGGWHHEFDCNSQGNDMDSAIKEAEKRFGIDIDEDEYIG